ncbi:MAG: tRNA (adenosine(37)-N6)-threonylcarbamoyltransferase complex ATPase subunit type 1 TsaE [Chlamydiota bacterium]
MGRIRLKAGDYPLDSVEDTSAFAVEVAGALVPNTVIALFGDLGSGKTTFVQALARALGIDEPVASPTFAILNIYEGSFPLYHFDLYRLKDGADFLKLGFEEYFQRDGVCMIEWPDIIVPYLPVDAISIHFSHVDENRRVAKVGGC